MDNLIEFLKARLDEFETMALLLQAEHGDTRPFDICTWSNTDEGHPAFRISAAVLTDETGPEYIRRSFYTPAMLLARIAADRQIIEWATDGRDDGLVHANGLIEGEYDDMQLPEQLLQLLALPFAGHPDFREEWKL